MIRSYKQQQRLVIAKAPNTACSGRWGFRRIFGARCAGVEFWQSGFTVHPPPLTLAVRRLEKENIVFAKVFMIFSSSIILLLGVAHLVYTFWIPKLTPRNPELKISMSQDALLLTTETTMWRAWIGFNASHGLGAILFGLIYGYLAVAHSQLLFQSPFIIGVGFAMLSGLFILAKLYWFRVPFTGISISLICYVVSIIASRA
jgi:hypothetical protein